MQWVVWLALLNNVAVDWSTCCRGRCRVDWWWVLAGFLLFVTPLGRMGIAVLGARMLLGGLRARHLPPRRVRAPAGLARRTPRRGQRRREPGRRAVAGLLRPRPRQPGRQGRRPALGPAGHRHAHPRPPVLDRTRGRPDRALDRRRPVPRRPHRASATTPPSAPGPRCCPAPSSARTPTSHPAPAWSARSRPASTGRARRR